MTPERVLEWKKELTGRFKPGTVNGKLAAANALFAFAGWGDCRLESLKVQRRAFREDARELSREEFYRLVNAAGAAGEGAAVAAAGGDCRDGDPGERSEVPDGRGGEAGGGGDCAEGENPDDPA